MLTFSASPQRACCAACHAPSIAPYGLVVVRHGKEDAVARGEADRVSRPLCMFHFDAAADVSVPAFLPPRLPELLADLRHRERIDDPVGAAVVRKQLALLRLPEAMRRERGQTLTAQRQRLRAALRSKHHAAAEAARAQLLALRRGMYTCCRTEEALDNAEPSPPSKELLLDAEISAAEIRQAIGERARPLITFVRTFQGRMPREKRAAFKELVTTMARLGKPKDYPGPDAPKFILLRENERALLRGQRRWAWLRQKFWDQGDLSRRARIQAQVDLFLLRNGLADWIDAKRQRRERESV